jgi:hypothetical protein
MSKLDKAFGIEPSERASEYPSGCPRAFDNRKAVCMLCRTRAWTPKRTLHYGTIFCQSF